MALWRSDEGRRVRKWLELDEASHLWKSTRERLEPLLDRADPRGLPGLTYIEEGPLSSESDLIDALHMLAQWDVDALRSDADRFASIYSPVGILPPDQYLAQVVQMTHGCSFNTCTFCTFYRDIPFRVKSSAELREHLEEVDRYLGRGTSLRHSIFLGDANALVVSMEKLEPLFEIVADHYSNRLTTPERTTESDIAFNGMHAFLDGFSGAKKSAEDYHRLRELGLRRITVGLESGHDPLLEWLHKPGSSADAVRSVEAMKEAGVQVCLVVLVGAGGETFSRGHINDTRTLLAEMPVNSEDIIYFSEFVDEAGSPYGVVVKEDGVIPLDREAMERQKNEIASVLIPHSDGGPRTALYDIREFTY